MPGLVSTSGLVNTQVTPTALTVVSKSPGMLSRILVTTTNGANAIYFYDNASAASGVIIGAVTANAAIGSIYDIRMPCMNGITIAANASYAQLTVNWM